MQLYSNFQDPNNVRFKKLDTHFQKPQQEGVGAEVKYTVIMSVDEEDSFWEFGILGMSAYGAGLLPVHGTYRIAQKFRGSKFSRISRYSRNYFNEIFDMCIIVFSWFSNSIVDGKMAMFQYFIPNVLVDMISTDHRLNVESRHPFQVTCVD